MTEAPVGKSRAGRLSYIHTKQYGRLIERIWRNESTYGTNMSEKSLQLYCFNRGQFNEWGYNPQKKQCFKTWNQGVDRVDWQLQQYAKRGIITAEAMLRLYSSNGYGDN